MKGSQQLGGVRVLKVWMREKEAALFERILDLQTPCCQSAQPSVPWGCAFLQPWGGETTAGKEKEHNQTDAESCGSMCVYVCVRYIFARLWILKNCACVHLHMHLCAVYEFI